MDAENRKPQIEDIDRWLDLAIGERANAEPRSGLEERVLARLAARVPNRIAWWPAMAAVAVLLVVTIGLVMIHSRDQKPIIANGQQPRTASRDTNSGRDATCCPSTSIPVSRAPRVPVRRFYKHHPVIGIATDPLPRLATFPAPRAATAQERMLARLESRSGSYEIANTSNDLPLRDLSIPELRIEPLEGTPLDNTPQE